MMSRRSTRGPGGGESAEAGSANTLASVRCVPYPPRAQGCSMPERSLRRVGNQHRGASDCPAPSSTSPSRWRTTWPPILPATGRASSITTIAIRRPRWSSSPGPGGGGSAGRGGLGARVDWAVQPRRQPSRCALPLRLDHGRGSARDHHRQGAAGVVPAAGGQARLPAFPRRLRGHRTGYRGRARAGSATGAPPLETVLVSTRAGQAFGGPGYVGAGCGMGREATLYLLERGGPGLPALDGWGAETRRPFHSGERHLGRRAMRA